MESKQKLINKICRMANQFCVAVRKAIINTNEFNKALKDVDKLFEEKI